jgi:hypothetical protein
VAAKATTITRWNVTGKKFKKKKNIYKSKRKSFEIDSWRRRGWSIM